MSANLGNHYHNTRQIYVQITFKYQRRLEYIILALKLQSSKINIKMLESGNAMISLLQTHGKVSQPDNCLIFLAISCDQICLTFKQREFQALQYQNIQVFKSVKSLMKENNMIMFRGKITVNPNTLNNQIHTYFFAHHWQQMYTKSQFEKNIRLNDIKQDGLKKTTNSEEIKQKLDHRKKQLSQYSYDKWIQLIKNVSEFNRFYVQCFKEAFPKEGVNINTMDFRAFRLFHDWSVWGDSTSYPEFTATAVFDSSRQDPIVEIEDNLHLTTKMGSNKCVIANQDTDNQDMSKLFAFSLNLNNQLKYNVDPSVNRTIHFRTVDTLPWSPSAGAHWFGHGKVDLLHGNIDPASIKWPLDILYKNGGQNFTEMKFLQYRFNHPTKVSSVVGYLMHTDHSQGKSQDFINHNWRIVQITGKYKNPNPTNNYNGNINDETTVQVFLKNIINSDKSTDVLVDVSAAILDANNPQFLPVFPLKFCLTIKDQQGNILKEFKTEDQTFIENLFHNRAGLLILKEFQLPVGKPLVIEIQETLKSTVLGLAQVYYIPVKFTGTQNSYNLQIKDRFQKTKPIKLLFGEVGKEIDDKTKKIVQRYETSVRYKLNYTKYGVGVNGKVKLALDSNFNVDTSGLTQYTSRKDYLSTKQLSKDPITRLNDIIDASPKFKKVFPNIKAVDHLVFQDKLKSIIDLTDLYIDKLFVDKQLQYTFKDSLGKQKPFRLSFQEDKETTFIDVQFSDGIGCVDIYLNKTLTELNNPRQPAMESLCLVGKLRPADDPTDPTKMDYNFTALYFQNPKDDPFDKIDWLNVIGPKLKLMGLMYPSMQNIVNLYDYDAISMNSMKRAFEIEDENHSRYMPATRQMSPITHRQIRRWLYNPVYDYKIHLDNMEPGKNQQGLSIQSFDDGKRQLIELVKGAFKLELTTIPLYLSALYSIKEEGEATKLIRNIAKDEMKHLFITSNILNAFGQNPPYPKPEQGPVESVPEYPVKTSQELLCFHFQLPKNSEWKELMNPLPLKPLSRKQLMRFIMIQMPGQAYQISITPMLVDFTRQKYQFPLSDVRCKCHVRFCSCQYKDKMYERASRINLLKDAIDAVSAELAAKPTLPQGDSEFLTIGMAYEKIMNYMWGLCDFSENKLFNGDPEKQFTYLYLDSMTPIINLRTALEQIRLITLEGEGSSMFTVTGQTNKTSHFIKFIEIFTGCDLQILSQYKEEEVQQKKDIDDKAFKRSAKFVFTPNDQRFPRFPHYTNVHWRNYTNQEVDKKVNSELQYQRLSDNLKFTQFPNTYAPRSFLNGYVKILEQLGFIFTTDPKKFVSNQGQTFQVTRLKAMENTIARMKQMTLNAAHIVHPNDTFDRQFVHHAHKKPDYPTPIPAPRLYHSAGPKYNLRQSAWLPEPKQK